MLRPVLSTEDTAVNKADKNPCQLKVFKISKSNTSHARGIYVLCRKSREGGRAARWGWVGSLSRVVVESLAKKLSLIRLLKGWGSERTQN